MEKNWLYGIATAAAITFMAACSPAPETQSSTASAQTTPSTSGYDSIVSADGSISFPSDYRSWAHLGSWAVVNEGGEGNGMHNVFTTPDAIDAFKANGEFPDGAVLVKEVYASRGAQLTTGSANWATDPQVWFVMIKDTQGRYPDNPLWGNGWGWALFNAQDPSKQVATDFQADCVGCHIPAESTDWIYTYAYPVLGVPQPAALDTGDSAPAGEPETMTAEPTKFEDEDAAREVAPVINQPEPVLEAEPIAFDEAPKAESATSAALGDADAGKRGFAVCRSCHSLDEGRNGLGPTLANLVGRKAGSAEGFGYSEALKTSEVVWTAETLDTYLADTGAFIPGNRMAQLFPSHVKDDEKRRNIVAFLVQETSN